MKTVQVRDEIIAVLKSAGAGEPESEARIIPRETAGLSATDIHADPDAEIDADIYNIIKSILERRLMREPLQYIYGRWDFMGLSFCVNEDVLIPRPDTEVLVETVLKDLHDGMRILDMCTGSGCILISLLKYSNDCTGIGVDISEKALEVARGNAESLLETGVDADKVRFLCGDLYEALDEKSVYGESAGSGDSGSEALFDIIVSNPPYIATEVISTLEPEVRKFEPVLALDGGDDGLDVIKKIISGACAHLIPGGSIYMEIGYDQGEAVRRLMEESGFADVEVIRDYAGLDRVVCARKPIL